MRKVALFLLVAGCAASAPAHDLWMQPSSFWVPAGASMPVSILIGHGNDRENWGIRGDRITLLRGIGPDGRVSNLMPLIGPNTAAQSLALHIAQPGTHLIVMESNHAESELPGARFEEFLAEEGLTAAILHRQRTGASARPGREIYSRRTKSLIQIGGLDPKGGSPATTRLGFSLEIVPERDPYRLAPSEDLPVRIFFEGRPLSGALVKLTNLDADARPVATKLSDHAGRISFNVPRAGKWLLNVVWAKPIQGNPRADYETTFSSLTFGYPGHLESSGAKTSLSNDFWLWELIRRFIALVSSLKSPPLG
jgi:uncharacterized GH25 family protein